MPRRLEVGAGIIYRHFMFRWIIIILISTLGFVGYGVETKHSNEVVYVIPVRDDIDESMVYIVRRGINEAIQDHAKAIILDMSTNGGHSDAMEDIMKMVENFNGETVTFVNTKAYSAGAFIAFATKKIYMAPSSVIGAAAPVMLTPTGGVQDVPSTYKNKISSAFAARIRAAAQRHGHNPEVADAMVKETDGLVIDGKTISQKGSILTLTDTEATMKVGKSTKPLLAEGIADSLTSLYAKLGYDQAQINVVKPTGLERLAHFITSISLLLLLIGIGGIYLEIKTPGVSLPGIIGATSLIIFFFGHYIAGLSGYEQVALFAVGIVLLGVELFLFPGHILPGMLGIIAILAALLWAMIDKLPGATPALPTMAQIQMPLLKLVASMAGAFIAAALFARWLPKSKGPLGRLVLKTEMTSSDGYQTASSRKELIGKKGKTVSILRPSGTARFDHELLDVMTNGEYVGSNEEVVVQEVRGAQIIVSKP